MRTCHVCKVDFEPRAPKLPVTDKRYQLYCSPRCRKLARQDRETEYRLLGTHWNNRYHATKRQEVIDFLGGACVRCWFDDVRALQIDHKHGGGSKDIRENHSLIRYRKIFAAPDDYQLLCANCNWIKRSERREVPRGKTKQIL